jgi:2,3-dimethylmalate lyase
VVAGVHDPLSALIAQRAGFDAVALSSFAASTALGLTDLGLVTMSEMVGLAGRIAGTVSVPVICDADAGFGGPLNVRRTVEELEAGGVAGVMVRDSLTPTNQAGKPVISEKEMVLKVLAAVEARRDPGFFVVAITDAAISQGGEAAIARGFTYAGAGADAVLVLRPGDEAAIRRMNHRLSVPSIGVVTPIHHPIRTVGDLEALGYRIVVQAFPALLAAARAMTAVLARLRASGDVATVVDDLMPLEELTELVGLPEMRDLELRYRP